MQPPLLMVRGGAVTETGNDGDDRGHPHIPTLSYAQAPRSFPNPQPFSSIEDIERHTDRLEVICDWRDELVIKHRRAMLLWDLGLITVAEFNQIVDQVDHWHRAVDALTASMKGARR
jgi:hypothetical protein